MEVGVTTMIGVKRLDPLVSTMAWLSIGGPFSGQPFVWAYSQKHLHLHGPAYLWRLT